MIFLYIVRRREYNPKWDNVFATLVIDTNAYEEGHWGALDVSNRKEVKLGKQIDVAFGMALRRKERVRADMNLIYIEIRHNNKSFKIALNYKL